MNVIERLVQTKSFKKFLSRLYGIGASVVVVGALFKIEHWPGASIMLSAGLFTEALIFFFFAFDSAPEPEHPEGGHDMPMTGIAGSAVGGSAVGGGVAGAGVNAVGVGYTGGYMHAGGGYAAEMSPIPVLYGEGKPLFGGDSDEYQAGYPTGGSRSAVFSSIDEMLQRADVAPDFLVKFGTGISHSMSVIEQETVMYTQQMQSLNKLLASLNRVYSQQRNEEDNYLKGLVTSAVESKKYRKQVAELNEHLSKLNRFYGDMASELDS